MVVAAGGQLHAFLRKRRKFPLHTFSMSSAE
jgi:hypothetical protein